MSDPLARLENAAERIIGRSEYEQDNRRGLLWVHALIGILAGVQMALWGTATTLELAAGPDSRYVMAAVGMLGGGLLAAGLSKRPRSIPLEVGGLVLVCAWDALMTAGLAYARFKQNDYRPLGFRDPMMQGYVVAYPITVYAGLAALIGIHLWTLRRLVSVPPMKDDQ